MKMTVEARYTALEEFVTKVLLSEDKTPLDVQVPEPSTRVLPRSSSKSSMEAQRELFLYAAKRFADFPNSKAHAILEMATRVVLHSAMDRYYGLPRKRKAA